MGNAQFVTSLDVVVVAPSLLALRWTIRKAWDGAERSIQRLQHHSWQRGGGFTGLIRQKIAPCGQARAFLCKRMAAMNIGKSGTEW
eukprot:2917802-Pleurochrysis_carterae.AAC.1